MAHYYYERISTKEERNKQSYARQDNALKAYAEANNLRYAERYVYRDDCSGATFNRPEWMELEENLDSGDTIIFKDISRFTRECQNGFDKYMQLMDRNIDLIFLDNPTISTPYIKNLTNIANAQDLVAKTALESTIKLLLIVELDRVEQERKIFIERVKQGIAASSKVQGRKAGQFDKLTEKLTDDIKEYINNRDIKAVDLMRKHKISRNTLKKYIKHIKEKEAKEN